MKAFAVSGVSIRRVTRDRLSLFFIVVLPIMVILIVGASVRGFSTFRIGVVGNGQASGRQVTALLAATPGIQVRSFGTVDQLEAAVRRSTVQSGIVLPADMDRALPGRTRITVPLVTESANPNQQAAATAVRSALAGYAASVQAARFATTQLGGSFDDQLTRAEHLATTVPQVTVVSRQADKRLATLPEGFSYSAPTMLVLFVFLNALAGSSIIIGNRKQGIYERLLAGPVRVGTVIVGEASAFVAIALAQAVLIVAMGALVFGVSWGDPRAAVVLVGVWALVGAGAGMLAGTVFSTPEQATAVGPSLGIALAMLGGCMWPLSIVGPTMRTIGHATPQAWAVDAWTTLLAQHGTLASIAPQLLVLGGFATVLLVLATWRLHRRLS